MPPSRAAHPRALRSLARGERLKVHCSDPLAIIDIPALANETGDRIVATDRSGERTVFTIEKA